MNKPAARPLGLALSTSDKKFRPKSVQARVALALLDEYSLGRRDSGGYDPYDTNPRKHALTAWDRKPKRA